MCKTAKSRFVNILFVNDIHRGHLDVFFFCFETAVPNLIAELYGALSMLSRDSGQKMICFLSFEIESGRVGVLGPSLINF